MAFADDPRVEHPRRGIERVNSRIDAEFGNLARQNCRRVKVRERGRRCRVGQVVGRDIDGLDRGDRTLGGCGDAFLKRAHVGRQCRLITNSRGDTAEKGRHFGSRLREAEDVVDEEQNVLAFLVTEIFGQCQAGQRDARAGTRRLVHLAVYQRRLRSFAVGLDNARFDHFVIEIVALAGPLADTGEYRVTAMRLRDVVDEFHDQNGLADAGTTEQADLAALCVWRQQVDDLDAGNQNLGLRRLVDIFRCRTVDRVAFLRLHRLAFIHRLADHVQDPAKRFRADRNGDRCAGVGRISASDKTLGRVHRDRANRRFTEMLRDFENKALTAIVDLEGVLNGRQMAFKLDIDNGADDLTDFADIVCHVSLLRD